MKSFLFLRIMIVCMIIFFPLMNVSAQCGTCNWSGSNYPVCCNTSSGWGWENNQSCISASTCNSQSGGGGSNSTTTTTSSSSGGGSSSSGSCPSNLACPGSASCGCYSVSGLGANKRALRSADVSNWNRIRSYWGSRYWVVHRNGESGANNPHTADIQRFKEANDWTDSLIGSHLEDDIRFWVDVPAI